VVPGGGKPLRQPGEQAPAVVHDRGSLAVDRTRARDDARAVAGSDGLVAQADTQDRQASAGADDIDADASVVGGARARGDHDGGWGEGGDLGGGDLVVADHLDLAAGGV
jgi:hypothetical protein